MVKKRPKVKSTKRKELYDKEVEKEASAGINIYDNLYQKLRAEEIDKPWIEQFCLVQGIKMNNVISNLRKRAGDEGTTLTKLFKTIETKKTKQTIAHTKGFVTNIIKH